MPNSLIRSKKADRDTVPAINYNDPMRLQHDINSLFLDFRRTFDDLFWHPTRFNIMPRGVTQERRIPSMDLLDKGAQFMITAEMPGVKKEDLHISITDTHIEIKSEHKEEKREEKDDYVFRERFLSNFRRFIEFPEKINSDEADAELKDGVLTIIMPKQEVKEKMESKKLEIK